MFSIQTLINKVVYSRLNSEWEHIDHFRWNHHTYSGLMRCAQSHQGPQCRKYKILLL